MRQQPGKEYLIPCCVTSRDGGLLPIHNHSDNDLEFAPGQLLTRGQPCIPAAPSDAVSVLPVRACTFAQFQLDDIRNQVGPHVTDDQLLQVLHLLNEFRECFAENMTELGKTSIAEMRIDLHDDEPVTFRPYRITYPERAAVRGIVEDLLENGIIQNSQSPYASPILLVKKKTGEYRMCVDFRAINRKTVKSTYPLPRVDDYLERVQGSRFFTTLDLASGYHQIKMAEDSIPKTAFVTPDGHYEYLRMPFGLVNAPFVFQRAVNTVLGNLRFTTAMAYLDYILLPTVTFEEGMTALREVLALFREAGMTFRLSKCQLFHEKLEYLGHELSTAGVQ